jgi:hypothetical protein
MLSSSGLSDGSPVQDNDSSNKTIPSYTPNREFPFLSRMLTALHVLLTGCDSSFRKRHGVRGFADTDVSKRDCEAAYRTLSLFLADFA